MQDRPGYDRPVMGKDLLILLELTQLDVATLGEALGVSQNVFRRLTQDQAKLPVDLPLATLVLYYLEEPEILRRCKFNARALREKLGLTQAAFGRLLGREPIAVSNWERGEIVPDRPIRVLARLLENVVPTEYERLQAISKQVWAQRGEIRATRRVVVDSYPGAGEGTTDHPDQLGSGRITSSD